MSLTSLLYSFPLRVFASLSLAATVLLTYPYFLVWIPLLPYGGLWALSMRLDREWMFATAWLEVALVAFLFARWLASPKTRGSWWPILLGLLALPSLLFAGGHLLVSATLLFLVAGGAGVYQLYREQRETTRRLALADAAILLWVVLGLGIKVYGVLVTGDAFITQRGGGILGSNHVGGVLLLLLPFARHRGTVAAAVAFLLIQFSSGIYLALAVYGLLWTALVLPARAGSLRRALVANRWRLAAGVLGAVVLVTALAAAAQHVTLTIEGNEVPLQSFLQRRLRLGEDSTPLTIAQGLLRDERFDLYAPSWDIARSTLLVGTGLGGYYWSLQDIGYPASYSNAHNVYVTSLAEGGLLFAAGLVAFLGWAARQAWRWHRRALVGLLAWMFYGLYSGELYEVGGVLSAGDFYLLLFLASEVAAARQDAGAAAQVAARREALAPA